MKAQVNDLSKNDRLFPTLKPENSENLPPVNFLLTKLKSERQENQNLRKKRKRRARLRKIWRKVKKFLNLIWSIFLKLFSLRLEVASSLWFLRVPMILTGNVTFEHFVEKYLAWLEVDHITVLLLFILFRIVLVIVFLIVIQEEVKLISSTFKQLFGFEKKTSSVFLFLIFTLIAVITVFF